MANEKFRHVLQQKGATLYRDMPWRRDTRPYYVLVSELMLQQTQVARVIPKFEKFVARFADEKTLSEASLAEVLTYWQGLGYNRRAKFLHDAAKMIMRDYDGIFPEDENKVLKLPGVGKNTAGAILAYAFNKPAIFIETNVRTVYIHHFFSGDSIVDDKMIAEKLRQTIDSENPRQFYQNVMDYGTHLKNNGVKNIQKSRHYKKQSPLQGSVRQLRGDVVRLLSCGEDSLEEVRSDPRFPKAISGLLCDGLIEQTRIGFRLTK